MIERRRLFVAGGAAFTYLTASGAGLAQPGFADIAGNWEGVTTSNVRMRLTLSADGQFVFMFLTGPAGGSMPRGHATWKDGVVIVKYGDTEINLTKSADGNLTGPYTTPRSKGVVTFTRQ